MTVKCTRRPSAVITACRCDECRADVLRVNKRIRVGLIGPPRSTEAWERIDRLLAEGFSPTCIASAAGLPLRTLEAALHRRRQFGQAQRFGRKISEALLAADMDKATAGRRDATGARRRLQGLARIGWSLDELAARTGVPFTSLHHVQTRVHDKTHPRIHAAVRAAWDELSMTPGPSPLAAARAARNGYLPPLVWDDETIDDPATEPVLAPEPTDELDEMAIELAMAGDRVKLTPAERDEAIRRLVAAGLSDTEVGERLHVVDRTVLRWRQRHGVASSWAA